MKKIIFQLGLNPCSNGILKYIKAGNRICIDGVLILVLMEY